ncbi:zinc finger protein 511 isoform X2 [Balaenoptera acutorostrata]|uniref:Zinc finger protein 511 isoform X2 n=1 Tax=Balaenoptera acutorostrata TaxID=9767 RepID=A0ABM3S9D8_BALAC|nr:zinc finger protein 511 isoform X2 [Balaenoptera acutorostrata]
MQLPPALHARLAGAPGSAEPLPVERDPAAGTTPFSFAPRLVRFPREHDFFEDGDVQRHLYLQDVLTQVGGAPERPRVPEFTCQVAGCCQVFDALEDYEHHYHALHRNVCSFCKRAFPSGHLLDTHILEWHDSLFQILAERQDMYQCLVEGCTEKFRTSRDRKEHLVMRHLYPADFRFDKPRRSRGQDFAVDSRIIWRTDFSMGDFYKALSISPAVPGAAEQVLAEALGDDRAPSEGDAMEVCSEHVEPSPEPAGERRAYSHRIPSTICFGQGASRGFKSAKKRNKHQ